MDLGNSSKIGAIKSLLVDQVLEIEETDEPADDGWTVVQSKSTTKSVNKMKSVVGANIRGGQQNKMVPTTANKQSTAMRSYADSVRGKGSECNAPASDGSCKCSYKQRECSDRRSKIDCVRPV